MHMLLVPCFNTSTELSPLCSHTDTQTQPSTPADRSCAGQHPSGRVLPSPAGSWQMPLTFASDNPGLEPDRLSSLCSPLLSGFLSSSPCFIPPSLLSLFPSDSGPRRPPLLFPSLPLPRLSCSVLSSSSSVHSDELASLQVSSGLSQHGRAAEGKEHGGLC